MPRCSLVIPAYNEARLLPRLLDSVDAARSRYKGSVQVIVADNASTDKTAAIAAARGCEVARVEKRRRTFNLSCLGTYRRRSAPN